jgi:hypothetical protein
MHPNKDLLRVFAKVKTWKPPKCPWMVNNKSWYIHTKEQYPQERG